MEQDKMNSPVPAPVAAMTLDDAQDTAPVETVDKVHSAARPPRRPSHRIRHELNAGTVVKILQVHTGSRPL